MDYATQQYQQKHQLLSKQYQLVNRSDHIINQVFNPTNANPTTTTTPKLRLTSNFNNDKIISLNELKTKLSELKIKDKAEDINLQELDEFNSYVTLVLRSQFLNLNLNQSLVLANYLTGWQNYPLNLFSYLKYFIENLPLKLFNYFCQIKFDDLKELKFEVSKLNLRSLIKPVKKEIVNNVSRLEKLDFITKFSIGYLNNTFDNEKEVNEFNKLDELLKIWESVLQEVNDLDISTISLIDHDAKLKTESVTSHQLLKLIDRLQAIDIKTSDLAYSLSPPTQLQKYWLPLVLSTVTLKYIANTLYSHRYNLKTYLLEVYEYTFNFLKTWLFDPILQIVDTIRYKQNKVTIMATNSLPSDLESLQRMVLDLTIKTDPTLNTQLLKEQIQTGDLTYLLKLYESSIQHPIKNVLMGDLLQIGLIQVQRAKVEVGMALKGIDTLLQGNQLTLAILGSLPPITFSYYVLRFTARQVNALLFGNRFQTGAVHLAKLQLVELVGNGVNNNLYSNTINHYKIGSFVTDGSKLAALHNFKQTITKCNLKKEKLQLIDSLLSQCYCKKNEMERNIVLGILIGILN